MSLRLPLWARDEWRRSLALRLAEISESPNRVAIGFAVGVGVACTPLIGLHFVLAVVAAFATRSSIPAAVLGSFAANPWTYPFTLAGGYAIGSQVLGAHVVGASIENAPGLRMLLGAALAGDGGTLSVLGPILGATMLGGSMLGIAVGTFAYLLVRTTLLRITSTDPANRAR